MVDNILGRGPYINQLIAIAETLVTMRDGARSGVLRDGDHVKTEPALLPGRGECKLVWQLRFSSVPSPSRFPPDTKPVRIPRHNGDRIEFARVARLLSYDGEAEVQRC